MEKQFRLYTGVLKAWTQKNDATGEVEQFVSGTTSSTIVDLQGDELTLNALESMRVSCLQNMTLFLNHRYAVPEDLFGSATDARIVKRLDEDPTSETFGKEVHDLDITIKVSPEDENPRAQKTFRAIQRGRKLGLSIGAEVTKAATRKAANGEDIWVIDGIALRESSVVGIPANQRSYLHNALKALRGQSESVSEKGIDRDLEEKGMGDRLRAAIVKAETAQAEAAEALAVPTLIAPEVTDEPADDGVSEGLEGLDATVAAAAAEAAPAPVADPAPAVEAHTEAEPPAAG